MSIEEFADLATTGYQGGGGGEQKPPEDELFHSVYIAGKTRKNHINIEEQSGKYQIRGVQYNLDEVHFIITHVDWISGDSLHIHGHLRIKGISRNIRFMATHSNKQFSTSFLINWVAWNIAFQGRWIDKPFVDKEIELKINSLTK